MLTEKSMNSNGIAFQYFEKSTYIDIFSCFLHNASQYFLWFHLSMLRKKLMAFNLWDFLEKMEGPIGLADCLINLKCNQLEKCNIKTPVN